MKSMNSRTDAQTCTMTNNSFLLINPFIVFFFLNKQQVLFFQRRKNNSILPITNVKEKVLIRTMIRYIINISFQNNYHITHTTRL